MKPLATGRLIIALCGALLPALFAPSATTSQTSAGERSSAINLIYPNGLALDDKGDLHISDIGAHRVLKLDRGGRLTVVAGTGEGGFGGDGGKALEAELNTPQKVAVARDGSLFIADRANHRVRKVDARGAIITIAGAGKPAGQGAGMMIDPAIR